MKDGESAARSKPGATPKKTEPLVEDPRDDLRGQLVKHRARLRAYNAQGTAQPPRRIVRKH